MARFIYSIGGVAVMTGKPAKQAIGISIENSEYVFLEIPDETSIRVLKQGDIFAARTNS